VVQLEIFVLGQKILNRPEGTKPIQKQMRTAIGVMKDEIAPYRDERPIQLKFF
jgi:hypothetical protein